MNNKAFIIRGISGTGKGTRVSNLIEFLRSLDTDNKTVIPIVSKGIKENKPGDIVQLGLLHSPLGLFFAGKWVKSNKSGMYSWSSMDGFSGVKDRVYWSILDHIGSSDLHFVAEGYFAMKGNYFGSNKLVQYGFQDIYYSHYLFENRQQLIDRCYNRSGSIIKGTPWKDNAYFSDKPENKKKTIDIEYQWYKKSGGGGKFDYQFLPASEPVWEFGYRLLIALNEDKLAEEYKQWSSQDGNTTLRDIEDKEDNIKKYSSRILNLDTDYFIEIELKEPKEKVTGVR